METVNVLWTGGLNSTYWVYGFHVSKCIMLQDKKTITFSKDKRI